MPRTTTKPPDPARAVARLREMVDADGRSLQSIADAAGSHKANLINLLQGQRSPTLPTLAALLAALGRTWGDLD